MKRKPLKNISSPEELDSHLTGTNPFTWISLGAVIFVMVSFLVWSFIATITFKVSGVATFDSGEVSLTIDENRLKELAVGQKVYIASLEGEVVEIEDNGYPVFSHFDLPDGEYRYEIVVKSMHPVDYFTSPR